MNTGNKTQNIKEIIDNVKSYSDETKNKNNNIIKQLQMIEKSNQSSVNKILKDKKIAIGSIESQYKNILKMLNDIETNVNDLVDRIKMQEEVDNKLKQNDTSAEKNIFKVLKDFTKNNIVGSTANNQNKMQPIQVLTNVLTKDVKIESPDDLSDLRDILISVIKYLNNVDHITLSCSGDYYKFVRAVYDKVKSYIFKDITKKDSIDNLVNGFYQKIQLFNTFIISPIIKEVQGKNTSFIIGTICTYVGDEFYKRLREYEWNDKLIEKYKQLTSKHVDKLKKIPEKIRNHISLFRNDFGVKLLMVDIKKRKESKYTEEVLRKQEIGKVQLPNISNNIKLNQQNNQVNRLNIKKVNIGFNNKNNLQSKNKNHKEYFDNNNNLQFKNENHKEYLKLLERERKLYKNNKGNINNNQSRKGTRFARNKFELLKK